MQSTRHLALPYLMPAQAQKHVTHNEALRLLDAIVQLSVLDRDLDEPPGEPEEGERHIVAPSATGDWQGWDGDVALFVDGAWMRLEPRPGWRAWVEDEEALVIRDGSSWTAPEGGDGGLSDDDLQDGSVTLLGVNTVPDTANRLAVKADAALFCHDDVSPGSGDMRVSLNKAGTGNDAALAFETDFSARALFGLLGSDSFSVTVSPDGSGFHQAVNVHPGSGHVGLAGATADGDIALIAQGEAMLFTNGGDLRFTFSKGAAGDSGMLSFQTGFSARAQVGLLGNDDFTIQVSPDGAQFHDAMVVDGSNGAAAFSQPVRAPGFVTASENNSDDTASAVYDLAVGRGSASPFFIFVTGGTAIPRVLLLVNFDGSSGSASVTVLEEWANEANLTTVTNTPLDGTTGDDGDWTLTANDDGTIQWENRLGGTRSTTLIALGARLG